MNPGETRVLLADDHEVARAGLRKLNLDTTSEIVRYAVRNKIVEA